MFLIPTNLSLIRSIGPARVFFQPLRLLPRPRRFGLITQHGNVLTRDSERLPLSFDGNGRCHEREDADRRFAGTPQAPRRWRTRARNGGSGRRNTGKSVRPSAGAGRPAAAAKAARDARGPDRSVDVGARRRDRQHRPADNRRRAQNGPLEHRLGGQRLSAGGDDLAAALRLARRIAWLPPGLCLGSRDFHGRLPGLPRFRAR